MKCIKPTLLLLTVLILTACGSSIITNNPNVSGLPTQLALGAAYPADLDIPNISGMSNTAFITLSESPYIVPINLDTMLASSNFVGLNVAQLPSNIAHGSGTALVIISSTQALLLTNSSLIYFNPTSGNVFQAVDLDANLDLGATQLSISDSTDVVSGNFTPSFASDVFYDQGRIYVSMANLDPITYDYRVQGLVLVYELFDTAPFIEPASKNFFAVSGFNPSAIFNQASGDLIVVSTGHYTYDPDTYTLIPISAATVDKIDSNTFAIKQSLNMGVIGLVGKAHAYDALNDIAYFGTYYNKAVYAANLATMQSLNGEANPLLSPTVGLNYVSDVILRADNNLLVAASFNDSTLYAIDLADSAQVSSLANFSDANVADVEGTGSLAFRPGLAGTDFTGPDLWTIQPYPGILHGIKTYE